MTTKENTTSDEASAWPTCPDCLYPLEADWDHCPYCKDATKHRASIRDALRFYGETLDFYGLPYGCSLAFAWLLIGVYLLRLVIVALDTIDYDWSMSSITRFGILIVSILCVGAVLYSLAIATYGYFKDR